MPSASDLLSQGPPPSTGPVGTGAPTPIGVPQYTRDPDTGKTVPFTVTRPGIPSRGDYESGHETVPVDVKPIYWTGDEWKPASWDPRDIAALQEALVKAGYIAADKVHYGTWDPQTRNAYTDLLGRANAMGVTWDQALLATPEAPAKPLQVKLTDPEDLRAVFKAAAFQVSSTQFNPAQIDMMIAAYHEKEKAFQEAAAKGDETITAPPDPTVFAETQAEKVNPKGVQERHVQNAENAWMKAIQGG